MVRKNCLIVESCREVVHRQEHRVVMAVPVARTPRRRNMEQAERVGGSARPTARLELGAALGLLIMAVAAPVALALLKSGAPALLGVAVLLFVVVAVLDLVTAWLFWLRFEQTDRGLSALAMVFRVVYSVLLLSSLGGYATLLGAPGLGFSPQNAYAQFDAQWSLALAVFGVHLVLLGALVLKSKEFHFVLGVLVIVAGLGYAVDSLMRLVIPQVVMTVSTFTFVGEALLIVWLPIHAFRNRQTRGGHQ
jgi:hypothetical protein